MKVNTPDDVANCIRKRREDINMSQRMLMKKSDVGHATISRVENRETDIVLGSLLKVLNALGLEMHIEKKEKDSIC